MKFSGATILFVVGAAVTDAAFAPGMKTSARSTVTVKGYLDDLSKELSVPEDTPDNRTYDNTKMKKEMVDRHGPGNYDDYVEFDEFDGGDGQMGVAGDGQKGLDKKDFNTGSMHKSKMMSAKNAWGTSTGYADQLIKEKGMDSARAQQLENWHQQQEVLNKKNEHKRFTASFETKVATGDEDWRSLAKFGVERNKEFDLDEAFGPVTAGDKIEGTIELRSRIGQIRTHEISLKNPYMGFADFRAAFTPDTPKDWSVSPGEGSIQQKASTTFVIKLKPNNPGTTEGHLVIQTEDFKKTWKVIGSTA